MGVLSRSKQEVVGLVADIEDMFVQVLVEPKDCDALRLVWWPEGELAKEVEEYRMVKHLFGATQYCQFLLEEDCTCVRRRI